MYGIHIVNTLRTYNVFLYNIYINSQYNNINCNLSNVYAHKAKI